MERVSLNETIKTVWRKCVFENNWVKIIWIPRSRYSDRRDENSDGQGRILRPKSLDRVVKNVRVDSADWTPDLFSGSTQFNFRRGYYLYWPTFVGVFFSPPSLKTEMQWNWNYLSQLLPRLYHFTLNPHRLGSLTNKWPLQLIDN